MLNLCSNLEAGVLAKAVIPTHLIALLVPQLCSPWDEVHEGDLLATRLLIVLREAQHLRFDPRLAR